VLQGILSFDDVLDLVAVEVRELAALLIREREHELHPQP
jgi:hypothetical protein